MFQRCLHKAQFAQPYVTALCRRPRTPIVVRTPKCVQKSKTKWKSKKYKAVYDSAIGGTSKSQNTKKKNRKDRSKIHIVPSTGRTHPVGSPFQLWFELLTQLSTNVKRPHGADIASGCRCPASDRGRAFFNKMLAEVKSNLPCPCLFPNAAACYRNVNVLLGGGFAVESTHALVCSRAMYFALQPVVERLREINLNSNVVLGRRRSRWNYCCCQSTDPSERAAAMAWS